ncbi:TRAP transporter large permease [Desulfopila inferna]|uniref:TRAP transporter large permease n=1 Tax=Desulfopila inferna TaxID=468528 RepID=UPI0019659304|nr:TRAP transporter large permease subunit [Desulfopila inferna]MBM9604710.1 TRAP transporter large permease subunit [Desulfopila inferna]
MVGESAPLIMFLALFVLLIAGVPIAFSLAAVAIVFSYFLWGPGALSILVSAAWGTMNNFVIIAVPLFIYMAYVLQKTNVVEDLYDTFYKWSGALRGGLAIATILVGAALGAVSGVVAAGVIGLGLIGLPQMLKHGYNRRVALGSVLGGGTLGQLIPPSTNMVLYGAVTGVSIGGLFAGGISAGVLLASLYIVYVLIRGLIDPSFAPALPPEERATWKDKVLSLKSVFFPLLLVVIVLGSILLGMASPTEAAAFGAAGALFIGLVKRRLTWDIIYSSCYETLSVTAMVGWMMIGATAFGSVFSGLGGNALVADFAMNMPGGAHMVFVVAALFVFFMGMFLEPGAVIFLAVPIIAPILANLGFEPLWIGLVINVILQSAYISPPFGFSLFYLQGCAPAGIDIIEIYKSSVPLLLLQVICVALIFIFPQIVLWLPKYLLNL